MTADANDGVGHPTMSRTVGRVLIGSSVFAVSLVVFFRVPFLPAIGVTVGLTDTQLAVITTSYAIGRLAIDLPAGRLSDRIQPYALMAVALLTAAAGSIVFGRATHSTALYLGALLLGAASGISGTTGLRYFSTATSLGRRASSVSIYSSVLLVGQASGPPIAVALAGFGTWRTAHLIAGVALVVVCAALVLGLTRSRSPVRLSREPHIGGSDRHDPDRSSARLLLYFVPLLMFGVFVTTIHTLVPIIGDDIGVGYGSIGIALGIGGAFRFVAIVTGGQIADRVGRKAALVPALVLSAVGIVLLGSASAYAVWLASVIALSMGSIAISVSATVVGDLSMPGRIGINLATWRFTGDLGMVAVPLISGWTFDHYGPDWALFPLAIALVVLAVLIVAVIPETRGRVEGVTYASVDSDLRSDGPTS